MGGRLVNALSCHVLTAGLFMEKKDVIVCMKQASAEPSAII